MQLYRKRPSEKEKRKEHNRQICLWAVRSHAAIEIVHILFLMRIFRSVCVWKWTYVRENTMSFAMEIGVQHRRSYTIICQFFENSATQNDSMILNRMYSFCISTLFYICSNLWFNILGVIVDEMLNGIYYRVLPGDYFVIYSWIRVLRIIPLWPPSVVWIAFHYIVPQSNHPKRLVGVTLLQSYNLYVAHWWRSMKSSRAEWNGKCTSHISKCTWCHGHATHKQNAEKHNRSIRRFICIRKRRKQKKD